ncbi:MAG: carbonic anhydrase family protein [Magnetococcales bacterium]|nr:carbonic anhydrase family protein [Magnetococcales bacterium]
MKRTVAVLGMIVSAWVAGALEAGDHQQQGGGHGGGAHWGYSGAEGPEHWGTMGFPLCSSGKNQSPIDIGAAASGDLDEIVFRYTPSPIQVKNNGHTVQFDLKGGSFITVGGKRFDLVQFHFHSPSENTVQGKVFPMEVHLVHKSEAGELAVVGILMNAPEGGQGTEQGKGAVAHGGGGAWDLVMGALPAASGLGLTSETTIDVLQLLPHDRKSYYHWMGSLTTPPCTEGVRWFLMKEPVTISASQLSRFRTIFSNNARPVQPLNSRNLFLKGGSGPEGGH